MCVELTDDNVGIWCVCMSCHEPSWKCLIDLVVYVKVCLVYSYIVMSGIDWDDSILCGCTIGGHSIQLTNTCGD